LPRQPCTLYPHCQFTPGDGWGALELAARYSVSDLNYRETLLPAAGGIRGGEQTAITLGVNWYVNNNIRFLLDYQWVEVDRLSTGVANAYGTGVFVPPAGAQIGQDLEIVSIRTQFTF
jgi:phosphate-selective porin OprO/OprP